MKQILFFVLLFSFMNSVAQDEQVQISTPKKAEGTDTKVFYSQKLINTKTVEVLRKGILEFNVAHNFGDIAGDDGGITNFFGLDNASDVRIGFQVGLTDKLNMILSRTRGSGIVKQMWELGFKYQVLKQKDNDPSHPFSLTVFVNDVMSSQPEVPDSLHEENSYLGFSERQSQVVQLLIARKFGNISLQLNPLYLHTGLVVPNDQASIFALGGGIRLPISKKIILIADYFHPFRSENTKQHFDSLGMKFYDPFGIGFEILTEGHVFHINFTNAKEILENRFIRRTTSSWGNGEFRWAFTISRSFVLFRSKKTKGG
ncbi:MAG TPA: DUF5777 family beta-barrel protein [Chitinophagaceae bacterium]|nr:DUF5777 family beta-barrel protein [Chitinophagaceae bacterium]